MPSFGVLTFIFVSLINIVTSQTIDPNSVPISTRGKQALIGRASRSFVILSMLLDTWCTTQESSCPLLCYQTNATDAPIANTCTAVSNFIPLLSKKRLTFHQSDLSYSCICSNGISPNASQYSETIPYFECTEFNNQCVNNCPQSDSACASACRTNNPCGAQDPIRVNLTTASSTMSATAASTATGSGGADYTGFGGSAATTTSSSADGKSAASTLAIGLGQTYGLGVVIVGFLAGFALVL